MTRLEEPRWWNAVHELADPIVVQYRHELGHEDPALLGLHAHRELVAKVAHRALSHAWDAQVLAQRRSHLEIELVERHDPIDRLLPRQPADRVDHMVAPSQIGHHEKVVDALARPVEVAQRLSSDQQYTSPLSLALAQKVVALVVAGEAKDRDGGSRHVRCGRCGGAGRIVTMPVPGS